MDNKIFGFYGEQQAVRHLMARGFTILEKNYTNKIGEIDIVAKDKGVLVFLEVKSRMSLTYGKPYESVHAGKQRKMIKMAYSYLLHRYKSVDVLARFDVISIYKDACGKEHLEHIENAFEVAHF